MADPFEDKIYQLYYDEVGKHPLLTAQEERALLVRYHTCPHCQKKFPSKVKATNCPSCGVIAPTKIRGRVFICTACHAKFDIYVTPKLCFRCGSGRDMKARQKLIESNLRFVIRRAKSITANPEHLRKLISAGNIGLMLAIDKFNLARNTRFLTYAEWWIRKEMLDEIHASSFIHIPTHRQKSMRREQKEGRYVCRACGLRTDHPDRKIRKKCIQVQHDFILPLHSDATALNDTLPIDDVVVTDTADDLETRTIDSNVKQRLRQALFHMNLSERDRFIIIGYFNISQEDRQADVKSLHQLATMTGITPERVRQIKVKTLTSLSKELKRRSITYAELLT